jgi:serine protease Do
MKKMKTAAAVSWLLLSTAGWAQGPAQTIEGRLDRRDPMVDGTSRFDDHRVSLTAGQRVAITVATDAFDPIVALYRVGEPVQPVGQNDDDGMSLNSRLVASAPAGGDYYVRVQSFGGDGLGPYTIGITPLPPLPAPVTAASGTETQSWRVFEGEIGTDDAEAEGRRFDDYQISLRAGELALIRADSTAIDPMVQILPASNRDDSPIAADDDSGPELGAFLGFEAPEAGDYIVRVVSVDPARSGAYTLRIAN